MLYRRRSINCWLTLNKCVRDDTLIGWLTGKLVITLLNEGSSTLLSFVFTLTLGDFILGIIYFASGTSIVTSFFF